MIDINKLLVDNHGGTSCGDYYEYDSLLVEIRQAMEGKLEQKTDNDNIILAINSKGEREYVSNLQKRKLEAQNSRSWTKEKNIK